MPENLIRKIAFATFSISHSTSRLKVFAAAALSSFVGSICLACLQLNNYASQ